MKNFFERQDQARTKTRWLVILFILAVFLTGLAVHALVSLFVSAAHTSDAEMELNGLLYWTTFSDPTLLFWDFLIVSIVIGGGSLFKTSQLSSTGGDGVAKMLGGKPVNRTTTNPQERQLLNIVEEMAIASGIRVPNVYILRDEPHINAFAAGFTPATSVVAVTQGALDYLNRDELQGVIGHEFSHILHGDTNINLRLIGALFGLSMLVILGVIIIRNAFYISWSSSSNRDGNKSALAIMLCCLFFGLGLIIIGSIGMLFSNIIQAAISRQREFLADASAVQFTRNPNGIAGALKKIGSPGIGSAIKASRSVEASHMFFGNIFTPGFFSALFNTHPPLEERIKRLDPEFNGKFPQNLQKAGPEAMSAFSQFTPTTGSYSTSAGVSSTGTVSQNVVGVSGMVPGSSKMAGSGIASALADNIGQINGEKLKIAASLLESIPQELSDYITDSIRARSVIYAILLDADPKIRTLQLNILRQESIEVQQELPVLLNSIQSLSPMTRVPVAELAFPLLKTLSDREYRLFRKLVIGLVNADNKIDIFEYTLQAMIIQDLDVYFKISGPPKVRFHKFSDVAEPFCQVLSYLAWSGNDDQDAVYKAFQAGCRSFTKQQIIARESCSTGTFSKALFQLAQASPTLKQQLLTAFYSCIADDGVITERENELIRAITAIFGCPMPVWSEWAK